MTISEDTIKKMTMRQLAEMVAGIPKSDDPAEDATRAGLLSALEKRFWDAFRTAAEGSDAEGVVVAILKVSHEEDERAASVLDDLAKEIGWERLPPGTENSCTRSHSVYEDIPARWMEGNGDSGEACCVDCLPNEVMTFISYATMTKDDV